MGIIIEKKITTGYDKVMLTESLYSLALYIYINDNKTADTLFLLGDVINNDKIKKKLENYIIYNPALAKPKNNIEVFLLSNGFLFGRYKEIHQYINYYKVNSFFGHDHLSISPMLYSKKMIIIEDGLSNYKEPKETTRFKSIVKKIFRIPIDVKGYDFRTEVIYLTGMSDISNKLSKKACLIDRMLFIISLSEILGGVFYYDLDLNGKCLLLITQPFSEDGFFNEENKIKLYKKMSNTKLTLIIKPHPRELTNYKKYFPEAIIIANEVLAESLLENDNIVEIRTVFSSAILNYPYTRSLKLYIRGSEFNSNLLDSFGCIPEKTIIFNEK